LGKGHIRSNGHIWPYFGIASRTKILLLFTDLRNVFIIKRDVRDTAKNIMTENNADDFQWSLNVIERDEQNHPLVFETVCQKRYRRKVMCDR
jgi:squalene cyclase